jgi:hypothetical protein
MFGRSKPTRRRSERAGDSNLHLTDNRWNAGKMIGFDYRRTNDWNEQVRHEDIR